MVESVLGAENGAHRRHVQPAAGTVDDPVGQLLDFPVTARPSIR
jgi:hypothetical protein